jgi:hypothetical protein
MGCCEDRVINHPETLRMGTPQSWEYWRPVAVLIRGSGGLYRPGMLRQSYGLLLSVMHEKVIEPGVICERLWERMP